jgi:hypothetical protein
MGGKMCDVIDCPHRGIHKIMISALEEKFQREIYLCEKHWTLVNEMGSKKSEFKRRLKEIDYGRFRKLIDVLDVVDECQRCFFLNPKVSDPGMGFRCRCAGSCIADTLSNGVKSYLFWKLGEITEEQHKANMDSGKFLKIGETD